MVVTITTITVVFVVIVSDADYDDDDDNDNNNANSSSSSAFPARYQGFTIFGEIFAYVTIFNPTTVVTFSLHG